MDKMSSAMMRACATVSWAIMPFSFDNTTRGCWSCLLTMPCTQKLAMVLSQPDAGDVFPDFSRHRKAGVGADGDDIALAVAFIAGAAAVLVALAALAAELFAA